MRTKLKFGLNQVNRHAPRWLINTTSVIALVIAAKHHLINNIPVLPVHAKAVTMAWIDYVLDAVQVLLAVAVIFFGEHKNQGNDAAGN